MSPRCQKSTQSLDLIHPTHTDDLHELVCLGFSSDEEDSVVLGLDDISVTEEDYPLYDDDLLSKLLYRGDVEIKTGNDIAHSEGDEPGPVQCATNEPTGLINRGTLNLTKEREPLKTTPSLPAQPPGSVAEGLLTTKHTDKSTTTEKKESAVNSKTAEDDGSSLTTLSSYFSHVSERTLESAITRSLGVERLTVLGRVTKARICINTLELDSALVDKTGTLRLAKNSRTTSKDQSSHPKGSSIER